MKYFKVFLLLFASVIVGLGVAVYRIADIENSPIFFHNGNWIGSKNLPLGKNNLLTAQITCFGLFALPGDEAVYLAANRDNHHEKFNSKNDYLITGNINQIHAKYWSITVYGRDLFLIPNKVNIYSFNNLNIQTDTTGNFSIIISHQKHTGNWLPSAENAHFNLLFRLYKGDQEYIERLNEVPLPVIKIVEK